MTFETNSPAGTVALGAALGKAVKPGSVIACFGGLGVGKTAFTRGVADGLGVTGEVSSPTFALVHEYQGTPPLIHFDMYRVVSADDLYSTGFFDYLDGRNILIIEWSENIEESLPDGFIRVTFEVTGETSRRVTIEGGPGLEYPKH